MRILWVKAGGLVPPDTGGKIRSYSILKHLAKKHDVTLFTFYRKHHGDAHGALTDVFRRVVCMPLRMPDDRSLLEAGCYLQNVFSLRPYAIRKFCRPGVAIAIRSLLREEMFDVMVVDFAIAGGVIPWEDAVPKLLFTHNVEGQIWLRQFQSMKSPLWKAAALREYLAMSRAEQSFARSANHVLTVSEPDRKHFSRFIDPSKITVIATGVDVEFFRPIRHPAESNVLVFTGSMDWSPNQDGMFYLLETIFPSIKRQVPDVQLRIVGRAPSARLRARAARISGVQVTGRVDDIRPYVQDAAVYVVPLRIGGGTRIKIFEAMAMGKAIVATSIGAEGLPVAHGKNILLCDQAEQFASSVVTLLRNPLHRQSLGAAARRLVEDAYSWESVSADFEKVLAKVAVSGQVVPAA